MSKRHLGVAAISTYILLLCAAPTSAQIMEMNGSWELNPAKSLGIDKTTGTLEPGKDADVVLWSADPFSVYAHADQVFVDGALIYDRADRARQPVSDFMLGILPDRGGGQEVQP